MRSRTIKPDFYMDEDLASCSIPARFLFHGLWGFADREGRFEWKVKRMKAEIFPYDNVKIEGLLAELVDGGFVVPYSVDGENYGEIPNFRKHQPVHPHEAKSVIPERSESVDVITCNGMSRHFPTEASELVYKGNSNSNSNSKGISLRKGVQGETKTPHGENGNVYLSESEGEKLFLSYGESLKQAIEILDAWIESKPGGLARFQKKYSSAFSVLSPKTSWVRERLAEKQAPKGKETNREKNMRILYGNTSGSDRASGIHHGGFPSVSTGDQDAGSVGGAASAILSATAQARGGSLDSNLGQPLRPRTSADASGDTGINPQARARIEARPARPRSNS